MKSLKEKIEVMQAALDGKTIQFRDLWSQGALNEGPWSHGCPANGGPFANMSWDWNEYDYRVEPQPPAKKTVAMQPEDYPPVFWVRRAGTRQCALCTGINGGFLEFTSVIAGFSGQNAITVHSLSGIDVGSPRPCEYSVDRKTWLPCTKQVDA